MNEKAKQLVTNRANRYRDKMHRKQFEHQVFNPPVRSLSDGRMMRNTGSGIYFPFWNGYDGVGGKAGNQCQADVAWSAGKFRKELETKGLLEPLPALKIDTMTGRVVK